MMSFKPSRPVIVISPHLDDAVLSCARLIHSIPGTTVVSVLAGAPDTVHEGYNSRTTGEPYAPDAVSKRRDEDASALSLLTAEHVWLDFLDNDYLEDPRTSGDRKSIRDSISNVLKDRQPGAVVAPLGLVHLDHLVVSDACLELAIQSDYEWYIYMDLPYGRAVPQTVLHRIGSVETKVNLLELEPFLGDPDIKRRAMRRYESQYGSLKRSHRRAFRTTMNGTEQYWKIMGATAH
jgi:LmbE family N-acetylglucosaminyl deacetylase